MFTMELLGKIRRMHVREKPSVRSIVKRTSLSRNTVHKSRKTPEISEAPKYVRTNGISKLRHFTQELEQDLKADALRAKKDRRRAGSLFAQIKSSGPLDGHTRVTEYIRAWRTSSCKNVKAFLPLKFDRL